MLFATSAVSIFFGSVHGITLAFGVTLLGVAVDYPVHAFSHSRSDERFISTIHRIWPTLRLGVFTTILGYAAMAMTDLTGLAQLGVFSIIGLATAALLTRSLLPALIPDIYPPYLEQPRLFRLAQRLDVKASKLFYAVIVLLTLLLLSNLWRTENIWSEDITELSPVSTKALSQYQQFREQTGIPDVRYFILIAGKDIESILQTQESMTPLLNMSVTNGDLQGFEMISNFIPSLQQQTQRQNFLPDSSTLRSKISESLQELPLRTETFEFFIKDVESTRDMKLLNMDVLAGTPLETQLQRLLLNNNKNLFGLVRLHGVVNPQHLGLQLKHMVTDKVYFVDTKANSNRLLHNFRTEALQRIAWALALIIVILWLGLRDGQRMLRVMLPVILAVAIAAAVPLVLGENLNLFHLVSLLLVAGIGLDYGLFFSRNTTEDKIYTLHALLVCAISTSTVFAMLAFSRIPVLHAIGTTVSVGVVAAFVWSWLLSRTTKFSN
jgi:predicted exporter